MKIFRPFRQDSSNNFSYLKYPIGEIFLVAVGILIALQVNNLNQSRIEEKAMNDYFQKIIVNIQEDIKESNRLLKFRQQHILSCNEDSRALIENDFSDQLKIQKAIFEMIIEVQLNLIKQSIRV